MQSRTGGLVGSRDICGHGWFSASGAGWVVLSIGKLAAGPDAGRYYEEAVAQGREDYYAGEGEAPGHWAGAGAAGLGLRATVADGEVGRLLAGEDPGTGALLGRP